MANVKISDLTEFVTAEPTDVVPVVDLVNDQTKKIKIENLARASADGTAAAPGIAFSADRDTGIYRPAANQFGISTGGVSRFVIDDSGDITIGGDVTANSINFTSNLTVAGNLTVNGTTTTINSTTLQVDDKNIELGTVASATDATADGGGITLKGDTDHTILWTDSTDSWDFSEHLNIASAKEFRIAGTKVLDATSLGSAVVSSSLTSVGTISSGTWNGTPIATDYIADDGVTADKLADTAVTAGSYTAASITVDAQGRLTSASSNTIPTNNNQLTNGAGYITSVNLGTTTTSSTNTITNDQGNNATLDGATSSVAGLMTSADKTKLDGIETGATADQTGAEIKTAYESQSNTNAFTDAEKSKLSGIAAGAEVNVDTNLSYTASTRVLASSTGTNATLPEVVAAGNSGLMTGADKTKLNGIETGATADQTKADIDALNIDADTVDGLHASSFLRSDASDTATGVLTIGNAVYGYYNSANTDITGLVGGSNFGSLIEGQSNAHLVVGIRENDIGDSFSVVSGSGNYATDSTYDKLVFQAKADGTLTANGGNTIWHAGNDGLGSGLDADTVDGIQASSLLRSDASDTYDGSVSGRVLTFECVNGRNAATTSGSQFPLQIYQTTANADAAIAFHVASDYAAYFGLDGTTNDLFWGGWSAGATKYRIWHAGNDGSGSGLDADTLDGLQSTSFIRSDADDTFSGQLTGAGQISVTGGKIECGRTSGSVAMTVNDGYGNANLCFNHAAGVPDVSGSSCRIETQVDTTSGAMTFEIADNVTSGVVAAMTETLKLTTSAITYKGDTVWHAGNFDPGSIPQNAKTAAYTLLATDAGKHVSITTGGVTVPSGVFSTGDAVTIYNNSTSNQTITASGVTLRIAGSATSGNKTLAQYGLATLLCVASNVFVIGGAGVS